MSNPLVVVFPRGQLAPKDKERMTKAGVIAVEADDPSKVSQINLSEPLRTTVITGDGIVLAALETLARCPISTGPCDTFVKALHRAITRAQP